jgi:hypothetical protein
MALLAKPIENSMKRAPDDIEKDGALFVVEVR